MHDLAHISWIEPELQYPDPARHPITAGQDIDDLSTCKTHSTTFGWPRKRGNINHQGQVVLLPVSETIVSDWSQPLILMGYCVPDESDTINHAARASRRTRWLVLSASKLTIPQRTSRICLVCSILQSSFCLIVSL